MIQRDRNIITGGVTLLFRRYLMSKTDAIREYSDITVEEGTEELNVITCRPPI